MERTKEKPIILVYYNGKPFKQYTSITKIVKELGVSYYSVYESLDIGTGVANGYSFIYKDYPVVVPKKKKKRKKKKKTNIKTDI